MECLEQRLVLIPAGTRFACKTIPKIPKRGKGSPRYLLKLQTEVDAMVQLGPSLDAVYLKVSLMGWPFRVMSEPGQGLHQHLTLKGAML